MTSSVPNTRSRAISTSGYAWGSVSPADPIGNRARRLEVLLGGRAPWLVRWLPVIGVALGLGLGGLVWLVVGS